MKILDFYKKYPTEKSCKKSFKESREEAGIVCVKCKGTAHYWKPLREQWQCKKCRNRTTLKSGTVMHNSKMSFQSWFIAMHLVTSTKKSFSAKEIQRQIGHKRYEPIWSMVHKIRSVMGLRDELYQLTDQVELDDGLFETVSITRDKSEPLKRGRGSQKQTAVLVCVESKLATDEYNQKKHGSDKKVKYLKMKVLNSFKKEETTAKVEVMLEKGSQIVSDKSTSYNDLKQDYEIESKVVAKSEINKILPWVHKAISNAKRLLLDVHHRIDDDFLENYLNEYCYKFNRRYFDDLFERLMIAAVSFRWDYLGETYG
jgi:hypothetical protein